MAPSPLGRDALRQALSPAGRVVIVNKSPADDSLTIAAAAIARHDSGGASRQSLTRLDVAADESEWIEPPLPAAEAPALIEVLLRISRSGQIVETYASATPPSPPPPRGWEAGIRPQSTPADPADVPIPRTAGLCRLSDSIRMTSAMPWSPFAGPCRPCCSLAQTSALHDGGYVGGENCGSNTGLPSISTGCRRWRSTQRMFRSDRANVVMAGLVPAIPLHKAPSCLGNRDARDTSAFTRVCDALLPAHDDRK